MPDPGVRILLDQNSPFAITQWLRGLYPGWTVEHVKTLDFEGRSDEFLFRWASERGFAIVTYDEDFADSRFYSLGRHHGIVRLRVWPTTVESTREAIERLLFAVPVARWDGCLIIVDNAKIRIRGR